MVKEARGFGATLEEAKENAVRELNASDFDDIQFDIISFPKKKVLGIFGGSQAEVRAFVEVPDKKQKPAKKAAPAKDKKEVKAEKPAKAEKTAKVEAVKTETAEQVKKDDEYGEPVEVSTLDADSPAAKAVAYIKPIIESFNCEGIDIKVALKQNGARLLLTGEDINIIIGRRGETLDALQYLASLAANNGGGRYKISINVGNYREKREETLVSLAQRVAAQALKTGKCRTLEPMNPYERRIIHTAVQEIEGVVSGSFGDGAGRRVVIAPEGVELKPRRDDRRRDDRRRGGNRRPSAPRQTAVSAPAREPKKDTDIPLYGKIN